MTSNAPRMFDSAAGYGRISRILHWLMAALFLWQFISALLHLLAPESAAKDFFWATHYSVGATLWALVLVRGIWGLVNLRRRPAYARSALGRTAIAGHVLMYALMVAIPTLALLRAIGSGYGLSLYGLEVLAASGVKNALLMAPANAMHGILGWTLLALIVGHVAMALWHARVRRDGVLTRMTRGG